MSALSALREMPQPPAGTRLRVARAPSLPRAARRLARAATLRRPRLVRPLLDDARSLALLVAPAGYGKSVLLADWCAHDPRRFAWVRLTPADDDPAALLASIGGALGTVGELEPVLCALEDAGRAVLVLDDAHHLRSGGAADVLAGLTVAMPPGSTLAIAARRRPPLPLARLRA
jgi:LuxR family transcriptional regulator, maltose regulon positive regulatory protein